MIAFNGGVTPDSRRNIAITADDFFVSLVDAIGSICVRPGGTFLTHAILRRTARREFKLVANAIATSRTPSVFISDKFSLITNGGPIIPMFAEFALRVGDICAFFRDLHVIVTNATVVAFWLVNDVVISAAVAFRAFRVFKGVAFALDEVPFGTGVAFFTVRLVRVESMWARSALSVTKIGSRITCYKRGLTLGAFATWPTFRLANFVLSLWACRAWNSYKSIAFPYFNKSRTTRLTRAAPFCTSKRKIPSLTPFAFDVFKHVAFMFNTIPGVTLMTYHTSRMFEVPIIPFHTRLTHSIF